MKALGKLIIVIVFLLAVGAGLAWFALGPQGVKNLVSQAGSAAGDWAGRQVLRLTETYIEPTIDYGKLTYTAPGTVTLTDVTFTSSDGTEVIRAGRFIVTLAEVPKVDQPIVIESVALEDWTLQLLTETDANGEFLGFKGLLPFVKEGAVEQQDSVEEQLKLSNVFRIRSFKLSNGTLVYDAGDGTAPMRLEDIDLDTSVSEDPSNPGSYGIALEFERAPVLDMTIDGTLDIDAFTLDLDSFELDADVADEQALTSLPPQVQEILRSLDARGRMSAKASGMLPLTDPIGATLSGTLNLEDFNIAQGEYRYPIDRLDLPFQLSSSTLTSPEATIETLEGRIAIMDINLNLGSEAMPFSAAWSAEGLKLQDLLRQQPAAGEMPNLAGEFTSTGRITVNLDAPANSLGGDGTLTVREGRLISIPVITDLLEVMNVLSQVVGERSFHDKADAEFAFEGDKIRLTDFNFENAVAAVRGQGTIATAGDLDLSVNAGPLEKVTGGLGAIGGIVGSVTDRLVKYRVRGKVGDPKVSVAPLGIGG
ncbi:MAG: hypothetical protein ACTS3F_06190 [Phycisphaerales bacterium]